MCTHFWHVHPFWPAFDRKFNACTYSCRPTDFEIPVRELPVQAALQQTYLIFHYQLQIWQIIPLLQLRTQWLQKLQLLLASQDI